MKDINNKTTLLDRFVLIEIAVFVSLGLAIGTVWFNVYVKPSDEFRERVMQCMDGSNDMSRAGYDHCIGKLITR